MDTIYLACRPEPNGSQTCKGPLWQVDWVFDLTKATIIPQTQQGKREQTYQPCDMGSGLWRCVGFQNSLLDSCNLVDPTVLPGCENTAARTKTGYLLVVELFTIRLKNAAAFITDFLFLLSIGCVPCCCFAGVPDKEKRQRKEDAADAAH